MKNQGIGRLGLVLRFCADENIVEKKLKCDYAPGKGKAYVCPQAKCYCVRCSDRNVHRLPQSRHRSE